MFLHIDRFPLQAAQSDSKMLAALAEHYIAHRFDLLGSGWVQVTHGMACAGLEGHRHSQNPQQSPPFPDCVNAANRGKSARIRSLISGSYRPIDWQLDFKSGYRWREDCWYKDIAVITGCPGADIKVPWELARCQHLPQLALAYGLARAGVAGFREAGEYQREYRNQVVDFIAANPPRFGVNWACPMDIGIRVANWLLAHNLFVAAGARFDDAFETLLLDSVHAHGRHIASNLEWNETFRSNHYLADLAGLLFAGAYLPPGNETDRWIRTAISELGLEIPAQFTDDGANFEASTCYHRLSAEMVVYSLALLMSILRKRLPLPWHVPPTRPGMEAAYWTDDTEIFNAEMTGIIERAGEFSMHATKEDHRVVQTGDNDSGRFFKLQPACSVTSVRKACLELENLDGYAELKQDRDYWLDESLDHRHLTGAIGALFARQDLTCFAGPFELDAACVRALAGGQCLTSYKGGSMPTRASTTRIGCSGGFADLEARLRDLPDINRQNYRFELPGNLMPADIGLFAYPDFGLFFFKASGFYAAVRCGPHGQAGNGGHAHNDQLSVELTINGHVIAADPGTYLYTPLPVRRNEYRAASAHFAPHIGGIEPGKLAALFSLPDHSHAVCLYFGSLGFIGRHMGYGTPVYRILRFAGSYLDISDYAEGSPLEKCRFSMLADGNRRHQGPPFSAGYGIRSRRPPES